MALFDKRDELVADFQAVEGTAFWKKYLEELEAERDAVRRRLEIAPLDKVCDLQGRLWAFGKVLRLPDSIVKGKTHPWDEAPGA